MLSLGLSAACGIVLQSLYPVHRCRSNTAPDRTGAARDLSRPGLELQPVPVQHALSGFLHPVLAGLCPLLCAKQESVSGPLPPYPDPVARENSVLGRRRASPSDEARSLLRPRNGCRYLSAVCTQASAWSGRLAQERPEPHSAGYAAALRVSRAMIRNRDSPAWCLKSKAIFAGKCRRY